jgi:YNFM family putative membrane transporter
MPPTPYSGHTSSGPHSAAANAPDARLDTRRLRSLIVISFSASVAFTAMYSTQPILPQISQEFHVSPAEAGLTLLAVTFALAVASLVAGRMADAIGARRMMLIGGILLSVFSVAAPLAPTFASLVALRVAQGLAVPGITIAGLAYLHNELPPAWRGRVSGFYIAANTLGGLLGRLMVGLTVETLGWRGGLALVAGWVVLGTLALALAIAPSSRRRPATTSQPITRSARPPSLAVIIRKLWWAPLIGGTIFLPFLTVFSYAPYLLESPPFHLSPTRTSLIYLVYLLGAVASPIAGNISDRVGRRPTIQVSLAVAFVGLACTLVDMLPLILLGLALVCIGSLMAHVVANASVSDAANPLGAQARATALALYTLGFYIGGGVGSFVPGLALVAFGWNGVIALCVIAVVSAFLCSLVTSARPERGAYVEPTATAG